MTTSFALTYDYRCPFARNAHEHVLQALAHGATWQVDFAPFSLTQAHVDEGGLAVWDDPAKAADLLAIEASLVVRRQVPERFLDLHRALFAARHDQGLDLRSTEVVTDVLDATGCDADAVMPEVKEGWPRQEFRAAHEELVRRHHVFGVPTFVVGDAAVFVRIMTRPAGDGHGAQATIDNVLSLIEHSPELNEFKHTSITR